MKLVRYGNPGAEKPGLIDAGGKLRDLSAHVPDIGGSVLTPEALARLRQIDPASLPEVGGTPRLGPCVGNPGKFICIGLNYTDHAAETGAQPPAEPIVFMKATSALSGPHDNLELPRGSEKTDWEVELGIIIGKTAKYVSQDQAFGHVAGYCTVNDVSERAYQIEHGGQWVKGKSADTFGPVGPWLVTRDEIADPQDLPLWLKLNGETMQAGSTANMIFGVSHLVSYLSRYMTLHPGDIITTGTPAGVGMGRKPQLFLKPGDVVELAVEGLGVQRQVVTAPN